MRDVLQRALAGIFEHSISLTGQLFLRSIGDANTPWLRQCLQPRGDVDAIPEQVAAFYHYVTHVDADAKHDAALGGHLPLTISQLVLDGDSTGHRVDNRAKFHDCAIAHQLDDAAPMLCYQRVHDLRANDLIASSVRASSVSISRE